MGAAADAAPESSEDEMACMCGGCEQCLHDQGYDEARASHDAPPCDCGQPLDGGDGALCVDCAREAAESPAPPDAETFDAYVARAREESKADVNRPDWVARRVVDRGPKTFYRYQVEGVNLNCEPGAYGWEFVWDVPALSRRYDTSHAEMVTE